MPFAIRAISQIFDSIRNIITGVLRGFHDTKVPMLANVFVTWIVSIPLGYLLGITAGFGPGGISLGFLIGMFIGAIILLQRFYGKFCFYASRPFVSIAFLKKY